MTPRMRMESSVAPPSGEHGSVVIHRKAFHAARAAGEQSHRGWKNPSIFAIWSSRSRLP
jgi:hypothetical protein